MFEGPVGPGGRSGLGRSVCFVPGWTPLTDLQDDCIVAGALCPPCPHPDTLCPSPHACCFDSVMCPLGTGFSMCHRALETHPGRPPASIDRPSALPVVSSVWTRQRVNTIYGGTSRWVPAPPSPNTGTGTLVRRFYCGCEFSFLWVETVDAWGRFVSSVSKQLPECSLPDASHCLRCLVYPPRRSPRIWQAHRMALTQGRVPTRP